jgi:hippurate hydrolase
MLKKKVKLSPSLHSSKFAPDYNVAIPTGIKAMSNAAVALFNN